VNVVLFLLKELQVVKALEQTGSLYLSQHCHFVGLGCVLSRCLMDAWRREGHRFEEREKCGGRFDEYEFIVVLGDAGFLGGLVCVE